jgi:hypothetical protein
VTFGRALGLDDGRLLVGAPAADSARGRVYSVSRTADGGWSQPRAVGLGADGLPPGAAAGWSLEVDGDRAYIGAPGAARVFVLELGSSGDWAAAGTLQPDALPRGSQFGYSVASVGEEVWVGAPGEQGSDGRVYRFAATSGGWGPAMRLDPDQTDGTSWPLGFGYAIAASGDAAVVSMPTRDFGEGRAMALARAAGGWTPEQILEGRIFRIGSGLETATGARRAGWASSAARTWSWSRTCPSATWAVSGACG